MAQQVVPPSADAGRFDTELKQNSLNDDRSPLPPRQMIKAALPGNAVPAGADTLHLTLKQIRLTGVSVYSQAELEKLWQARLGHDVTLQQVYDIAAEITRKYREDGYILSRAYIPAQEIDKGLVRINVVEGYVSDVRFQGIGQRRLLEGARQRLIALRPLNIRDLERQMLLLDDLNGYNFHAVLEPQKAGPDQTAEDGGVILAVVADKDAPVHGSFSLDNTGSRYIGPWLANADIGLTGVPYLPFQKTDILFASSVPLRELKFFSAHHVAPLTSNGLTALFDAGYSIGNPGFNLTPLDIQTNTFTLGTGLDYAVIRQRQENLYLHAGFDVRNSLTDISNTSYTKDKIRAIRAGARYDLYDGLAGYNQLSATASHGLTGFGASDKSDPNLSRANGRPDFTKLEASAYRTQYLSANWSMFAGVSGQFSNNSLLSSEEFGYGGGNFGRAFDPSELLGDSGFSMLAEMRYDGLRLTENSKLQPFAFYDFGKVWNRNTGQAKRDSAASVGGGLRLQNTAWPAVNLTIAQPLTRAQDDPSAYGNPGSPRFLFSMNYGF